MKTLERFCEDTSRAFFNKFGVR